MAISPPGTLSLCERENLCYRHPSNNISISDLPIGGVLRGRLCTKGPRFKRPPHRARLGTAVTRGKNVACEGIG